ncbi:integral membrane protein, partial [Streptomyces sp. MBRL 601]
RRRRFSPRALVGGGLGSPLLLLAAALLVAGAVLGNLFCLLLGWLTAYLTKRLTPVQAKFAALGIPALTLLGGAVWLWGRTEGRWGEPIPEAGMADAITGLWPVLLRTAAVASAVFLLWRARRRG